MPPEANISVKSPAKKHPIGAYSSVSPEIMTAQRIRDATRSSLFSCSFPFAPFMHTGEIAGHAAIAITEANVAAKVS